MKYLGTLERFFDPLYNGTPASIVECMAGLMNAVKMIYTVSRYGYTPNSFFPDH